MKKILIGAAIFLFSAISIFFAFRGNIIYQLKKKNLNVILITIDTLRADRLGCYGYKKIKTPNLDNICKSGVKFEMCISQVPLTLPSHTTILSGTYPFYHNVKDNGGFVVPEELETLPEVLKKYGFKTGAVIGAYVLDGKWGLNQGFDFYYDKFDLSKYKRISLSLVERRAEEVVNHAIDWLKENKGSRFFLWVHVYDPHTPYNPPPPFNQQYEGRPYDGEIAYTDSQLGRFFEFLQEQGLKDRTILIIASDHGESLGEHGEETHGFFIYQSTVRVPLIIKIPVPGLSGKVVRERVGLVDIAPTILDLLGYKIPEEMQGKSLKPLIFHPEKSVHKLIYTESYYPRLHFGWNDLKAIYWKNYKYIKTTKPELYDLSSDKMEMENIYFRKNNIAKRMDRMMNEFLSSWKGRELNSQFKRLDAETKTKLAALGYVSTFVNTEEGKELPDPKDKIGIFNEIIEARKLTRQGKMEEAIVLLQSIIRKQPDIVDAIFTLGNLYYRKRDFKTALKYFKRVLELKPDYNFAMLNILNCYRFLGEVDRGIAEAREFLKIFPKQTEFYVILANFLMDKGRIEDAENTLKKALSIEEDPIAVRDLGIIYLMKENLEQAEELLRKSLSLNPSIKLSHYNLALIYEKKGYINAAIKEYENEIKGNPENIKAHFNVARLYREKGERDKEIIHLEKVVEIAPDFQIGLLYLAKAYLDTGKSLERAINLAKKGIELDPHNKYAVFGYYILSDIYSLMGDTGKAEEYYKKGLSLSHRINKFKEGS